MCKYFLDYFIWNLVFMKFLVNVSYHFYGFILESLKVILKTIQFFLQYA